MPDWLLDILTDPKWVGGATWGSGAITVVGLALTYGQARRARQAAEAARQATVRTVRELGERDHLVDLGEGKQLATRIKEYATGGNIQAVRLALEMLRAKIDSVAATAHNDDATVKQHRDLDRIIGNLERHADEAAVSPTIGLDATMISSQLNDVVRTLSRRMETMRRLLPEVADG